MNARLIIEDLSNSIKKSVGKLLSTKRIISGLAWRSFPDWIAMNPLMWSALREHQRILLFLGEVNVKIGVNPRFKDSFAIILGTDARANALIK